MSFYNDILQDAVKHASIEFGRLITVKSLLTKCKSPHYTEPRWFCMAYMHAIDRYSYPRIARAFGMKDHTTVLHGLRRAHGHDGVNITKAPLWTKERFKNMAMRDGRIDGAIVSADLETIIAVGESNLKRFVNGRGWAA